MKKISIGFGILLLGFIATRLLGTPGAPTKNPSQPMAPQTSMVPRNETRRSDAKPDQASPQNDPEAAPEARVKPGSENQVAELDSDLSNRIKLIQNLLPPIDRVRTETQDGLHGVPQSLIEVGGALGELEEYLDHSPGQFKAASQFYADCAENRKILPAARALCIHSLKKHPNDWAPGIKERISTVDPQILELESQI